MNMLQAFQETMIGFAKKHKTTAAALAAAAIIVGNTTGASAAGDMTSDTEITNNPQITNSPQITVAPQIKGGTMTSDTEITNSPQITVSPEIKGGTMTSDTTVNTGDVNNKNIASTGAIDNKSTSSTGPIDVKTGAVDNKTNVSTGAVDVKTGAVDNKTNVSTGAVDVKTGAVDVKTGAVDVKTGAVTNALTGGTQNLTGGSQTLNGGSQTQNGGAQTQNGKITGTNTSANNLTSSPTSTSSANGGTNKNNNNNASGAVLNYSNQSDVHTRAEAWKNIGEGIGAVGGITPLLQYLAPGSYGLTTAQPGEKITVETEKGLKVIHDDLTGIPGYKAAIARDKKDEAINAVIEFVQVTDLYNDALKRITPEQGEMLTQLYGLYCDKNAVALNESIKAKDAPTFKLPTEQRVFSLKTGATAVFPTNIGSKVSSVMQTYTLPNTAKLEESEQKRRKVEQEESDKIEAQNQKKLLEEQKQEGVTGGNNKVDGGAGADVIEFPTKPEFGANGKTAAVKSKVVVSAENKAAM